MLAEGMTEECSFCETNCDLLTRNVLRLASAR